jgi:hypothetical protein
VTQTMTFAGVHQIDAPVAFSIGGEGNGRPIGREDRRVLLGRRRLSEIDRLPPTHREAGYVHLATPVADEHHRLAVGRQGRLGMFGWIVGQAIKLLSLRGGRAGPCPSGCDHDASRYHRLGRLGPGRRYLHTHPNVPASGQGGSSHKDENQNTSPF